MKGKSPLVSIIVPMYNSERFLDKCITSLINQTLQNIEIILVNDASPDNSLAIANGYAEKDSRIKVVDLKKNVVASRNYGIEVAIGDYLGFVDADDWVDEDFYERLYNETKNSTIDIVIGSYIEELPGRSIPMESIPTKIVSDPSEMRSYICQNACQVWKNIYKRELITKDIWFMEHNLYCDSIQALWYQKAKSFEVVNDSHYHYFRNDISTVARKNDFRMFDRVDAAVDMLERAKLTHIYDNHMDEIEWCYFNLCFKNTFYQTFEKFDKLPHTKLKEVREMFLRTSHIKQSRYYHIHKNEKAIFLIRPLFHNYYLGIIALRIFFIYSKLKNII